MRFGTGNALWGPWLGSPAATQHRCLHPQAAVPPGAGGWVVCAGGTAHGSAPSWGRIKEAEFRIRLGDSAADVHGHVCHLQ